MDLRTRSWYGPVTLGRLGAPLLGSALALMSSMAWGQSRPALPAGNPLETLPQVQTPKTGPNVTLHVQPQAPSGLDALKAMDITPRNINITGAKAVPFDQVAALFKPFIGKHVHVGDLLNATEACTQLYRQRDYALSFCYIPAQSLRTGVVQVVVVEGYIAQIDIAGEPGNLEPKIRAIAAHMQEERPLRKKTFDRYMQILGMLPGTSISADVPTPTTTDGATRMKLTVKRKRYDVSSGIDFNHPGVQGVLNGKLNGLTPLGEQITASTLFPQGPGEQHYYAVGYGQLLGTHGLRLQLDGSQYRGNPDTDDQLPSYLYHRLNQNRWGGLLTYPLLLSPQQSLVLGGGLYFSNETDHYRNTINGAVLDQIANVRVAHVDLTYAQASAKQTRKLAVSISEGLDVFGAHTRLESNIPGLPEDSPVDTRFTKVLVTVSQSNTWGKHWGTVVSFMGQYSADHLPSTEQISFGGPLYGYGYDPGVTSGDSGWGVSGEVNRPFAYTSAWLKVLTPYVVAQDAHVYLNGGRPVANHLQTVALGLRLSDNKHYSVDANVAQPVGDRPPYDQGRGVRYNLNFSYQF